MISKLLESIVRSLSETFTHGAPALQYMKERDAVVAHLTKIIDDFNALHGQASEVQTGRAFV